MINHARGKKSGNSGKWKLHFCPPGCLAFHAAALALQRPPEVLVTGKPPPLSPAASKTRQGTNIKQHQDPETTNTLLCLPLPSYCCSPHFPPPPGELSWSIRWVFSPFSSTTPPPPFWRGRRSNMSVPPADNEKGVLFCFTSILSVLVHSYLEPCTIQSQVRVAGHHICRKWRMAVNRTIYESKNVWKPSCNLHYCRALSDSHHTQGTAQQQWFSLSMFAA